MDDGARICCLVSGLRRRSRDKGAPCSARNECLRRTMMKTEERWNKPLTPYEVNHEEALLFEAMFGVQSLCWLRSRSSLWRFLMRQMRQMRPALALDDSVTCVPSSNSLGSAPVYIGTIGT